MTTATAPDATEVYALGSNPAESARLQRQSDELRPQSAELLGRIGLAPGAERDRSRLRPERDPRPAVRRGLPRRARDRAGRRPGAHRDGPRVRQRTRAAQRGRGDGRRQAHRPAVGQLRPGARPDGAGHDPRTRGGARRDGSAGPAGRLGRQPGTRHRERVLLPAAARLGPAPRDLPRQLRPFRRRPARSAAAFPSCTGRPGWRRSRSWCTLPSTRRPTRAARSCPTWCAACGP